MENQNTHRRNIGVALLAGMMVAAPSFSLTANAQTQRPPVVTPRVTPKNPPTLPLGSRLPMTR
jgi:hypothetical protein